MDHLPPNKGPQTRDWDPLTNSKDRSLPNLEQIINQSDSIAYVRKNDSIWTVDYISDNISQIGYSSFDFYNKTISYSGIVHPDDIERIRTEVLFAVHQKIKNIRTEYRLIARSHKIVWISDTFEIIYDSANKASHFHGIITNINQRKEFEDELNVQNKIIKLRNETLYKANIDLKKSLEELHLAHIKLTENEEKFKAISDQALLGIIIIQDGLIKYFNKAFLLLISYNEDEILNWKEFEFLKAIYKDDEKLILDTIEKILNSSDKDEFHFEFRRFTKDGQIKWLSQWSRPVSYEGKRGILTTMVDIDEQKKRQDAISESETRLRTKLNLILSPDKPISNLNIKDLFDLEQLQKIQDSFAISNNIASIITDTEGIPITRPSNFNKICKFIRSSQTGRALCYNSDKIIGLKAREILKPFITKCSSCGFLDAGAPIIVGGQHIGTWLIGQVPDNKTNESQVSKFAEHIGIDPEKLIALFYEVKSVDIEQFKKVVNFLWVITGEISALGYNNLKQARDIEDRKKIEIALRESEELYRQLVQASPDGIALVDLKGKMLYVSPKAKQMFGFPTDYNAEDLCIFDYIHPSQRKIAISNVSSIFEKNAPHPGSYLMLRKDGSTFSAEVNSTPVKDYLGNTKGMISILRDITERKKVEEELIKAKNKAEESDNLKSAFLANMSHEIRTPMNGILGFASLLNERETTLRQRREYSEIINQNGNLLLKLIDDILDIAKIEAGQLKIFEAPFYLDQIMYKQYMLFKTLLKKEKRKDLKLSLILPDPKLSNQIKTDEARLNQVLTNLLSNSIKFTKKGLVEFGYTFESTKMLKFYVKDTGIGLTPDKFSIIFDRFRQAEESSAKNYGGTGLGLTISSNLVRLMGGKIWVESEIGKGSTFYFTIPFKPINGEKKQIEYLPAFSGSNHYDWHNKCILVVEDEHLNFLLLQEFLKNTCANLLWVQNGKEAIDLCKENNMINLVLMDLKLPKINGYTAICEIKKFRRNLPIIAQSAYAMEEEIKKCREAGCDEYITKPIDHQKLLHLINGYFKT